MKKIIFLLLICFFPFQCLALKIGLITDIHAGNQKKRITGLNITYPRNAEKYFKTAVMELLNQGADVILVLGDNTNNGKKKYYKKLLNVQKKFNADILWVKGNHDSHNNFKKYLSNETNYYRDYGDVRIVILDTNYENRNSNGKITPEGLALYNEAKETEKNSLWRYTTRLLTKTLSSGTRNMTGQEKRTKYSAVISTGITPGET